MSAAALSFIMPSRLEDYAGAAKNRREKLLRAVKSFQDQNTNAPIQLVIGADQCPDTVQLVWESFQSTASRIITVFNYTDRSVAFSGQVRNACLEHAMAPWVAYLDSDDIIGPGHAAFILKHIGAADAMKQRLEWLCFDDFVADPSGTFHRRLVEFRAGSIGTSNIAHRRDLDVMWGSGYGHDWFFIETLARKYPRLRRLEEPGEYKVCHVPGRVDI